MGKEPVYTVDEEAEKFKTKGNEFFKQGEYESAIKYYTKAIVRLVLMKGNRP